MVQFWMILFLTSVWCGFSSQLTLMNAIIGGGVSVITLYAIGKRYDPAPRHFSVLGFLSLLVFIIYELFKSSLQVAWDVITPYSTSYPQIIKVPINCVNPIEMMLLTNLISITPGTLFIDFNDDETEMIIHSMFAKQPEQVKGFIKNRLEPRVLRVFKDDKP